MLSLNIGEEIEISSTDKSKPNIKLKCVADDASNCFKCYFINEYCVNVDCLEKHYEEVL